MINKAFSKLKSNIELSPSFDSIIQQKHNAVRSVIENNGLNIKTKLIGSVGRKTAVNPLDSEDFDIDILVIMGIFDRWSIDGTGVSPSMAINRLDGLINDSSRYRSMNPTPDAPVVQFEYSDKVKVELVPAYIDNIGHSPNGVPHSPKGRAYWVPKNGGWELADYDYEANYISAINQSTDGLLIPIVKMLKTVKKDFFPNISSFHLEILALKNIPFIISYYQERNIPITYPLLVDGFFRLAKQDLGITVKIPGSHSPNIQHSSVDALNASTIFEKIVGHCDFIDQQSSDIEKIKLWKILFGDHFPTEQSI